MNEENKVVYLIDYIKKNKHVKTLTKLDIPLDLSVPSPHLYSRMIAFGVDILTIGLIKTSLHATYAYFISEFFTPLNEAQQASLINGNMVLHSTIFMLIYWTYFLYTSYILEGKTLGKMAMGLRVINEQFITNQDEKHYQPTLHSSLKRALGYLFCYMSFGTFFIFNFSSEDKRGLPDYLSSTRTVSDHWLNKMLEQKIFHEEEVQIEIESLDI
ncbi:MAG: RDD family protein, partial [Halobacteriovoraceae bacterium]|nr:RDD family protein [Halobacteriovoraceae bacterium]